MTLNRGAKLGPYEILDAVGAGGMGEVYKARDTRLDRTVAIKVLRAQVAASLEAHQRLEREARAVSSLNHPHICTLYDIGRQDGLDYLILEYLEGETLAGRLKKGPVEVEAALRYAIEIAGALDRAHRSGIVHRDLKPGNIMLTKSGSKLLDFGLAKVKEAAKAGEADATAALTRDLTSPGAILGTFQYMSPEQLEGKEADARSDIFAFGAVLYEMLAGRKAFDGGSQASLIASILTAQPPAVSSVRSLSPAALDRVVRTCLAKDPDERWQSAGDLARELKWIAGAPPAAETRKTPPARGAWIIATVAAVAALALAWLHFSQRMPEQPSYRFTVPTRARLASQLALSPDGTKLAFIGQNAEGKFVLWVRPLDKLEERALPGTESAELPFWSPDSRQIAFFDHYYQGHIKKVDAAGGQPQTICETPGGNGGDWSEDGAIIFASNKGFAIYRVSAAGGVPVQITDPQASGGGNHFHPSFLPDGRHFLYFSGSRVAPSKRRRPQSLLMGSINSSVTKTVLATDYPAAYAPASSSASARGRLLFIRDGALMTQEMDPASLQFYGEAVRVADTIAIDAEFGLADFSVSKNGVLALNTAMYQHELVWFDRAGKRLSAGIPVTKYAHPTLSPNGKQAIFEQPDVRSVHSKLWKLDVDRNEATLFEDDGDLPVFFPDGSAVAFMCMMADKQAICRKAAGGAGSKEILWESGDAKTPEDFSRDGRFMSYIDQTRGRELWILPLTGERKPYRFYQSAYFDRHGTFSPDGKFIAYTSNETGEYNVYVQPFPATGDKWKVSANGGTQPRWRGDGRELFYRTEDGKMMAVPLKTAGGFEAGTPHMLFQSSADPLYPNLAIAYAVTADGQRFLVNAAMDESRVSPITVITNWTAGLK